MCIRDRLEDKLKLIEQAYAIAYDGKVNYSDVFGSVRMWDMIIHNHLLDKNIVYHNHLYLIKNVKLMEHMSRILK